MQKRLRIKIIDKENGGYGIGMNIGLDNCTGDYVARDPGLDDYVRTSMYEDLLHELPACQRPGIDQGKFLPVVHDKSGKQVNQYNACGRTRACTTGSLIRQRTHCLQFIMNTWSRNL